MGKVWSGLGTTVFVATRVAVIVGAGLVVAGTIASVVDRLTGKNEAAVEIESEPDEGAGN